MRRFFHIKRLYSYILTTYIPLLLMTFAICLFLVLMQFLWKYVEDMVGKGLEISVLGEMFVYAALTLVYIALPLAILLASLMMFGNMGESLELLAVKAAGVPLLTAMKPLTILIVGIAVGVFFYQNNALPKIQTKFYSLLISIRQASPELDIPEEVFYKDIPGYNLYVGKKDQKTGMLHNVLIYDIASGFNNMAVIICDSAEMSTTDDKKMLIFTMYSGQQFQNFQQGNGSSSRYNEDFVPYARESFDTKTMMIAYDANFNRMGEEVIEGSATSNYVSKNLAELGASIDSMSLILDSVNRVDRKTMKNHSYLSFRNGYPAGKKDSLIAAARLAPVDVPRPDTLVLTKALNEQSAILQSAYMKADNNSNEFLFRSLNKTTTQRTINRHWVEWHRKFTIPFTCLIFFFIGAPLGSIVRKGGLGTPIVISVILFIIYYIVENVGYKMTRDGVWAHWFGMWFSSFVLLPIGIFLTYKAVNDSVIMNADTYVNLFKRLFFIRDKRKYPVKSVIIEKPDYEKISQSLSDLSQKIDRFLDRYGRLSYKDYWTDTNYNKELRSLRSSLEIILNSLSNSRKLEVLAKAEEFPVIFNIVRIFNTGSIPAKICMYLFPVGIILRFLSIPLEWTIRKDLRNIQRLNGEMVNILHGIHEPETIALV
ncbi:lipopolysaccharide export system permease protein [Porphyromonadaceae bacterium NLAE-zl-C104]|uniref:LptF/LptG family permease n=1 Tax=Proteiniphilum sp. TaxID=1926877 RepID=UPI0008E92A4A|nr:LptF/LptG family permease [Proteiniphilum sp.]MDY9918346.1 LptF/LptG family permease [Proteiniphilum sp.]SFS35618.1 lipopolysaccharide export system permease protein [Porphyromonadaceae bacterium NLAE-zl-C104]